MKAAELAVSKKAFDSLSEIRTKANDPAVSEYIDNVMARR
jgi:hypothetical protein